MCVCLVGERGDLLGECSREQRSRCARRRARRMRGTIERRRRQSCGSVCRRRAMEPPQGAPPAPGPGARPLVNPDEYGEVDTSRYPAPKDATNKVRGRSDLLELMCGAGAVDPELLTVKTFYFFFYSAFGSLFPLMGVYFKQMGMNAGQCGLLIGTRPFVEFLSAPFWGGLADRWQQGRTLLLASLGAWVVFTLPLSWVQPGAVSCVHPLNSSAYNLTEPRYDEDWPSSTTRAFRGPPGAGREGSPLPVSDALNYDPKANGDWVTPLHSFIVYRTPDIQKTFFLLLLLVVIGEFFSAPAITLADSAVITLLGEDADRYGHQRMFGSLGWGLAMFFVGIALDHSTAFSSHPCGGPQRFEKNYTICFATFSVLMGAALITATQIRFKYEFVSVEATPAAPAEPTHEEKLQQQLAEQLQLPGLDTSAPLPRQPVLEQAKVFAQTTREMPEWVTVLRQFQNVKAASFLFVAWFMGFGIGLIFTFLFWHLQDIGGSPTLFGVASVINHISEIFAYFFSFKLITQMGHVKRVRATGAVPGAGGQRAPLPVHRVAERPLVGAALRVRAGRDARRRVGRVLLVHRARRPAAPALVGAGRAAGAAPRAGPRLWGRAGRHRRRQVGHDAHVRGLRAAVHRGAGRVRVHQLPWRAGRGDRRGGRRGARRGRGGRAGAARRALQPAAARALLHTPGRPGAPRLLRRHAELQRRGVAQRAGAGAGAGAAALQPVPGGDCARRARLQISDATQRHDPLRHTDLHCPMYKIFHE